MCERLKPSVWICILFMFIFGFEIGCNLRYKVKRQEQFIEFYEQMYDYIDTHCDPDPDAKRILLNNLNRLRQDLELMKDE